MSIRKQKLKQFLIFSVLILVMLASTVSGLSYQYLEKVNNGEVTNLERIPDPDSLQNLKVSRFDAFKNHFEAPEQVSLPTEVLLDVPFTSQAPHGDWSMPYKEACEESSLIMVHRYLTDRGLTLEDSDREIVELSSWVENHGYDFDIGVEQTLTAAREYFGLDGQVYFDDQVTVENMKRILADGNPIIIPAAGRILANPHFSNLGPLYHMLVIVGYDDSHFITHDPGTRFGENYPYSYEIIENAIHDWNGSKQEVYEGRKSFLILRKNK